MFIYISVFVAILLVFVVLGYFFLPNSQFALSFSRKTFGIIVIILSALFIYLLGFGIYDLNRDHEVIKTIKVDGKPHLVSGIDGKVMFVQDKKIREGKPYPTVLYIWETLDTNELTLVLNSDDGQKRSQEVTIDPPNDTVYKTIKSTLDAKNMTKMNMEFPSQGTWKITFMQDQKELGTFTVTVYK